jgi:hypothetical protein
MIITGKKDEMLPKSIFKNSRKKLNNLFFQLNSKCIAMKLLGFSWDNEIFPNSNEVSYVEIIKICLQQ